MVLDLLARGKTLLIEFMFPLEATERPTRETTASNEFSFLFLYSH